MVRESVCANDGVALYMSSPYSRRFDLWLLHFKKGAFFCIDARSGATQWTSPPRQGENADVLVSGGSLACCAMKVS